MTITPVTQDQYEQIQTFLMPWEPSCVTLCSNVRKKKDKVYVITDNALLGVLFLDKTMFFCIPEPDKIAGLEQALADFLKDKRK